MTGVVVPVEVDAKDSNKKLEEINKNLKKLGETASGNFEIFKNLFGSREDNLSTIIKKQTGLFKELGNKANDSLSGIDNKAKAARNTVEQLTNALKNLVIATAAISGTAFVIKLSDQYATLVNKLNLVINETENLADLQESLSKNALSARSTLQASIDTYFSFGRALKETGIESERLIRITDLIQKTVAISNTPVESAKAALMQLGQGLASGTLRGEEFNSVAEQIPALAQAIAKGMGVAFGELRSLAATGAITPEAILSSLEAVSSDINTNFLKTTATVSQGLAQLVDGASRFSYEILKIINLNEMLYTGLNKVAVVLNSFSFGISSGYSEVISEIDSLKLSADEMAKTSGVVDSFFQGFMRSAGLSRHLDNVSISINKIRGAISATPDEIKVLDVEPVIEMEKTLSEKVNSIANLLAAGFSTISATVEKTFTMLPKVTGPVLNLLSEGIVAFEASEISFAAEWQRVMVPIEQSISGIIDSATLFLFAGTVVDRAFAKLAVSTSMDQFTENLYNLSDAIRHTANQSAEITLGDFSQYFKSISLDVSRFLQYLGFVDTSLIHISNIRFDKLFAALDTIKRVMLRIFTDVILPKYGDKFAEIYTYVFSIVDAYTDAVTEALEGARPVEVGKALGSWLVTNVGSLISNIPSGGGTILLDYLLPKANTLLQALGNLPTAAVGFIVGIIESADIPGVLTGVLAKTTKVIDAFLSEDLGAYLASNITEIISSRVLATKEIVEAFKDIDLNTIVGSILALLNSILNGLFSVAAGFIKTIVTSGSIASIISFVADTITEIAKGIDTKRFGKILGAALATALDNTKTSLKMLAKINIVDFIATDSGSALSKLKTTLSTILSKLLDFIQGFISGITGESPLTLLFTWTNTKRDLISTIQDTFNSIRSLVTQKLGELKIDLSPIFVLAKDGSSKAINSLLAPIKIATSKIQDLLISMEGVTALQKVIDQFKSFITIIVKYAKKLEESALKTIADFSLKVVDWFKWIYDKVVGHSYWIDFVDRVVDYAKNLSGALTPITAFATEVINKFKSIDVFSGVDLFKSVPAMISRFLGSLSQASQEFLLKVAVVITELIIATTAFGLPLITAVIQHMTIVAMNKLSYMQNEVAGKVAIIAIDIAKHVVSDTLTALGTLTQAFVKFIPSLVEAILSQFGTIGQGLATIFSQLPEALQDILFLALIAHFGFLGSSLNKVFSAYITLPLLDAARALGGLLIAAFATQSVGISNGLIFTRLFGMFNPRLLIAAVAITVAGALSSIGAFTAAVTTGIPLILLAFYGKNPGGVNKLIRDTIVLISAAFRTAFNIVPKASVQGKVSKFFSDMILSLRRFRAAWYLYSKGAITFDQFTRGFSTKFQLWLVGELLLIKRGATIALAQLSAWWAGRMLSFSTAMPAFSGLAGVWLNSLIVAVASFRTSAVGVVSGIGTWLGALLGRITGRHVAIAIGAAFLLYSLFGNIAHAADASTSAVSDLGFAFTSFAGAAATAAIAIGAFLSLRRIIASIRGGSSIADAIIAEKNLLAARFKKVLDSLRNAITSFGSSISSISASIAQSLRNVFTANWSAVVATMRRELMHLSSILYAYSYNIGFVIGKLKALASSILLAIRGLFSLKVALVAIATVGVGLSLNALIFGESDSFISNLGVATHKFAYFLGLVSTKPKLGIQLALENTLSKVSKVGDGIFDFSKELSTVSFATLPDREQKILTQQTNSNVAKILALKKIRDDSGELNKAQLEEIEKLFAQQQQLLEKLPQIKDSFKLSEVSASLTKAVNSSSQSLTTLVTNVLRDFNHSFTDVAAVGLQSNVAALGGAIFAAWNTLKTLFESKEVVQSKPGFLDKLLDSIGESATALWQTVSSTFSSAADSTTSWLSMVVTDTWSAISTTFSTEASSSFDSAWLADITGSISSAFAQISVLVAATLGPSVVSAFSETYSNIRNTSSNIASAVWSFIRDDTVGFIVSAYSDIASTVTAGVASVQDALARNNEFSLSTSVASDDAKKRAEEELASIRKVVGTLKDEVGKINPPAAEKGKWATFLEQTISKPASIILGSIKKELADTFAPNQLNTALLQDAAKGVALANENSRFFPKDSFRSQTVEAAKLVNLIEQYKNSVSRTIPEQAELKRQVEAQAAKVRDMADSYNAMAAEQKELIANSHAQMVAYEGLRKFIAGTDKIIQSQKDSWGPEQFLPVVLNSLGWEDFAKDYGIALSGALTEGGVTALQKLQAEDKLIRDYLSNTPLGSKKGVTLRFDIQGIDKAKKAIAELDASMALLGGSVSEVAKELGVLDERQLELIRESDVKLYERLNKLTFDILTKRIVISNTPIAEAGKLEELNRDLEALLKEKTFLVNTELLPRIPEGTMKDLNKKLEELNPDFEFKFTKELLKANPEMATLVKAVWSLNEEAKKLQLGKQLEEAAKQGERVVEAMRNLKQQAEDKVADKPGDLATALGVKDFSLNRNPAFMKEAQELYKDLLLARRAAAATGLSDVSNAANAEYLAAAERRASTFAEALNNVESPDKAAVKDAKTYSEAFDKQMKSSGLKGLDFSEYAGLGSVSKEKVDKIIRDATGLNAVVENAPPGDINFKNKEVTNSIVEIERLNRELQKTVALDKLRYRTFNDMMSSMGEVFEGFSISDWFRLDPGVLEGFIELDNRIQKLKLDARPLKDMSREDIGKVARELRDIERQKRQNKYNNAGYGTMMEQSGIDPQVYNRVSEEARNKIFQLQNLITESEIERKTATGLNLSLLQQTIEESKIALDNAMLEAFSEMPFEASKAALKQAGINFGTELGKLSNEQLNVVTQLSAKIRAVAYVAATTNDEDIRQAATALVEDATEKMNAFIKTAQTDLMKEAGTRFAESATSGFTEGFSALFKSEKTVKEFLLDQVDRFTKGVLDAFLAGLTAPLTDENGPVKTWLKEQGKALFQLGAQAFGYVAPTAIKPTATADTPWLIKMSAALDSILLAVGSGQAMGTLGYLRGFGSESFGRQVLPGSSGVFGKDVFSTGFDSLWKSNSAKEMTSVVSTGFDDVFKGITDSTKDFGDSMVDITSTLGSDFSGVTDSIGSIFKMGFSFISSMFADGGIVSYAGGGRIRGAGTGRSDSILARVSNGEYIVNAAKTAMYKPLLDAINYGSGIPAFANGGMYGQAALQSAVAQRDAEMSSNARVEQTFHVNVTGDVSRQTRNEIRQMIPEIAMGANIYNKEKNYR